MSSDYSVEPYLASYDSLIGGWRPFECNRGCFSDLYEASNNNPEKDNARA